jgi:lipopolysaccharide/colanic/teichoic acid biosynthesis glycosyltransferase
MLDSPSSRILGRSLKSERVDRQAERSLMADLANEDVFHRMLCLERKRTERSGRRFVLMLLEAGTLLKDGGDDRALDRVFTALLHSTRETDFKGWYRNERVIGVIYTEIGPAEGKSVANALLSRVTDALCASLSIDEINAIRLSFHVFPEDSQKHGSGGPMDLPLYPELEPEAERKRVSRATKRIIDIGGSLFILAVASPLLVAICAAVKLGSKGPVLFKQQRIGQYGHRFTFLKFRSMYDANDASIHREYVTRFISGDGSGSGRDNVFKLTNDPRITPLGRFLRRTSFDELPQLINVLTGEMSLVGPRPPVPYEFEAYDTWHKRRLLSVKPGITGLWQVGGRSRLKFDDMVRLDLQYATTWTVWLDLKILLRTPAVVVFGDGAY